MFIKSLKKSVKIKLMAERPFRPGAEKFIKRFEQEHIGNQERLTLTPERAKEKIRSSIERIAKEISEDVQREASIHGFSPSTLSDITNILSQAVQIALDEGLEKALAFIYATGNPHLIDAFHDILIEHFLDLLVERGKINLIT